MKSKDHLGDDQVCLACGYNPSKKRYFNKYFPDSILKSIFVIIYGLKYIKVINKPNIKVIVLTKFHQKFIEKIINLNSKVFVFPNPIGLMSDKHNEKENFIFYAGRISKEKGLEELITAFLKAKLENTNLKIAGEVHCPINSKINTVKILILNFLAYRAMIKSLNILVNHKQSFQQQGSMRDNLLYYAKHQY